MDFFDTLQPDSFLRDLLVTDLAVTGGAVARYQGRVVFLNAGIPGDRVHARITGKKKGTVQAELCTVCAPSPHTVLPWCPHANECGGCGLQHFSLDAAREWKRGYVRETLIRIGKMRDVSVMPPVSSPLCTGFRNKMAFAFAHSDNGVALGLRRVQSHAVVEVNQCGLQAPVVMKLLAHVRKTVHRLGLTAWPDGESKGGKGRCLRFLVVYTPRYQPQERPQMLVELITGQKGGISSGAEKKTRADEEAIRLLAKELMEHFALAGFVHSDRSHASDVAQGERMLECFGASGYQERFGHLVLNVPCGVFLQTNTMAAEQLYALVEEEAGLTGQETVWDLYSGVGSIALYLARKARSVYGLEIQHEAVVAAKQNSKVLGFEQCYFHAGAVGENLARLALPKPDIVMLDPPRAGLDRKTVEALRQVHAQKLLYISCDVSTQARDIAWLAPEWKVVKSMPVDMFPYTPHIENMVVLHRAGT